MSNAQSDSATQTFIEDGGSLMAESGLPRSAGRVLAWLLICEPAHQSAEAIQKQLSLSAGSVSSAVNILQKVKLLSRLNFPGDRRLYYRIDPGYEQKVLDLRLYQLRQGIHLVESGLRIRPGDPRLLVLQHLYTELNTAMRRIEPLTFNEPHLPDGVR